MVAYIGLCTGKVGMSVLVKGLAMDFIRQERNEMAITGIWPASVRTIVSSPHVYIQSHLI
jgi:hypothetical protein